MRPKSLEKPSRATLSLEEPAVSPTSFASPVVVSYHREMLSKEINELYEGESDSRFDKSELLDLAQTDKNLNRMLAEFIDMSPLGESRYNMSAPVYLRLFGLHCAMLNMGLVQAPGISREAFVLGAKLNLAGADDEVLHTLERSIGGVGIPASKASGGRSGMEGSGHILFPDLANPDRENLAPKHDGGGLLAPAFEFDPLKANTKASKMTQSGSGNSARAIEGLKTPERGPLIPINGRTPGSINTGRNPMY
ncbi:hypothetical protein B0H19DRAFT_1229115 [Mycena capillaripes]|nr:hypothetical protein B0H19DRAFT_1229115 [Mycena capillaripes]